ncbi:outer membrane protein assembly factor BamB family protein [Natrialba asiatica]|uniref:outer membrane protein assembly factor BamB family protein n=1 Tax=Natrialba asiatica TaxID=64602 RepID=UPI00373AF4E8
MADGHEFSGGELEAAWSVEGAGAGTVAVADETVYTPTDDGVVALDAADGTVVWENTEVDAETPSVAGESVYLSGNEVVALDRSDGSVRWETEFDPEEEIVWQTVADGGVYAVADGTLYALEADDGSVRWEKESITAAPFGNEEDEYEFVTPPAAANGVIYSVTGAGPIALEPETGTEVWQEGTYIGPHVNTIYATSAAVAHDAGAEVGWPLYDAQTGESIAIGDGMNEIAFGEEIHVGSATNQGYSGGSIRGDEYSWDLDVTYTYGQPVISGKTVYAYLTQDTPNSGERNYDEVLVALNKYDGSEKWVLSKDDTPVGSIRAISGETIYVDHDGELVALRDESGEDDQPDDSDGNDDTGGGNNEQDGSDEEADQQGGEDDSDTGGDDSGTGGDDGDDGTSADDGDVGNGNAGNADGGNETNTENNPTTDNVPGFTAGAGLFGGALGIEWLRRKAGVDESTSVNEPSE